MPGSTLLVIASACTLVAAAARAQHIAMSGHWQVNVDCGYYATATSFLSLSENVATGEVTALLPAIEGTIEFPTAIQRIASSTVVSGPTAGLVGSSGSFDLPAFPGSTRMLVTLVPPYDYVLLGCPVAGLAFNGRYAGTATGSGGIASQVSGTVYSADFDFRDASDTTCYAYAGGIPGCDFNMRRNDVPVGTNVSVEPREGTTVTFDTVTAPGVAAVMPLTKADSSVPPNFRFYGAGAAVPIYYEVTTTAAVSGPITTCFDYPDGNDDGVVDGSSPWLFEQNLRVLHEEGGVFVDRTHTLDTDANVLCARTTSLSQVTVGAEADAPIPWRDHSLAKAKLVVKRAANGAEKVVFVTKDPAFLFPEPGTIDDPRLDSGLGVEMFSRSAGSDSAQAHFFWDELLREGNTYVLRIPIPRPPFVKATLVRGRGLTIRLDATDLDLTAPQGALGVRVTTGLLRNCALFSDAAVKKDEGGHFVGRLFTLAPLADCSATSLGGSGE